MPRYVEVRYMDLELRIAVCDDEKYYREYMKKMIEEYLMKTGVRFDIDIYPDGAELCRKESNLYKYDVIFLDIGMPDQNGMETAHEIRKQNSEVDIVFITVMQEYVFEGYRVGAVRYIMKKDMAELLPECMDALLQKYFRSGRKMKFPFVKGERTVLLKDILCIEIQSHKLCFTMKNETLYMYGQMGELEQKMADSHFVRCHQSYLVNLEHIASINNYRICLSNGMEVPVSRSKSAEVKKCYLRYQEI